jgi:hypothetical protein
MALVFLPYQQIPESELTITAAIPFGVTPIKNHSVAPGSAFATLILPLSAAAFNAL